MLTVRYKATRVNGAQLQKYDHTWGFIVPVMKQRICFHILNGSTLSLSFYLGQMCHVCFNRHVVLKLTVLQQILHESNNVMFLGRRKVNFMIIWEEVPCISDWSVMISVVLSTQFISASQVTLIKNLSTFINNKSWSKVLSGWDREVRIRDVIVLGINRNKKHSII